MAHPVVVLKDIYAVDLVSGAHLLPPGLGVEILSAAVLPQVTVARVVHHAKPGYPALVAAEPARTKPGRS